MADYKVQMKQFNGMNFDNILPYASQALTLAGGGSATEIIAQSRAGLSQIATGSYVGNGVYTSPTQIQVGFRPKIIFFGTRRSISQEYRNGYVNGVRTDYNPFIGAELFRTSGSSGLFYGIMALSVDVPFIVDDDNDPSKYEQHTIVLIMEELNGVVTITQKCYYSALNVDGSTRTDFRTAKNQFNENGVTYDYVAIG